MVVAARFFAVDENTLNRMGASILTDPPDPKTIADPGFRGVPTNQAKLRKQIIGLLALSDKHQQLKSSLSKNLTFNCKKSHTYGVREVLVSDICYS